MIGLTHAQRRVLNFVRAYIGLNGSSPSYEEIKVGCWFSSKQRVFECLNALEDRGHIRRRYDRHAHACPRTIELNDPPIFFRGRRYRFIPIAQIPSHGIPNWRLPTRKAA